MSEKNESMLKQAMETSQMVQIAIENILPNPHRDLVLFPHREDTLADLAESYGQTGFWGGLIGVPEINMVDGKEVNQEELNALVSSGFDFSGTKFCIPFGHHRLEAAKRFGFTHLPLVLQVRSDEDMVRMMAIENKDGFGGNVNSQCETVRQVKIKLETMIQDFDTYEDYLEACGESTPFFATKKAFANALSQGVGYRQVKRFLGETWSDSDVQLPFEVIKAVDAGYFAQADVVSVPSISLLGELARLCRVLFDGHEVTMEKEVDGEMKKVKEPVAAPDWPLYYKEKMVEDIIARLTGKDVNVTVKNMVEARRKLQKDEVSPAAFLRTKKGKTPFNVYRALKEEFIIEDNLDQSRENVAGLKEIEGLGDWAGLDEVIEKLNTAISKLEAGEDPGSIDGDEGVAGGSDSDANAALGGDEGAFDGEVMDGEVVPVSRQVADLLADTENISYRIGALMDKTSEIDVDEIYTMNLTALLTNVALLVSATMGREVLVEAFNTATKGKDETPTENVDSDPAE
ncbi:MAG: hypothetical protein ACPKM1_15780 [Spirochaetaceae bacterium]